MVIRVDDNWLRIDQKCGDGRHEEFSNADRHLQRHLLNLLTCNETGSNRILQVDDILESIIENRVLLNPDQLPNAFDADTCCAIPCR